MVSRNRTRDEWFATAGAHAKRATKFLAYPWFNEAKHRLAVPCEDGAVKNEAKLTGHRCTPLAVYAHEDLGRGDAAKKSTAPFRKFEEFLPAR